MTNDVDKPVEQVERTREVGDRNDRLYWRASRSGRQQFELPAAGQVVTIDGLIGDLENTEGLDHLVLTNASARAAIEVLRALAEHAHAVDDAAP